jgi:hypothetical protein
MSAPSLYQLIQQRLQQTLPEDTRPETHQRLALLVMGMIASKSAAPAQIARALRSLDLVEATAESVERRIRRIENDPTISDVLCFHPFAKAHLALGKPKQLLLILDPTCQEDRVVLVSVAVWYRGRALPLCWAAWEGNVPLEGEGFWQRISALLDVVATLLPKQVSVILLADRAFGTPAFTDLVVKQGWSYVVRVQDQTRARECTGRIVSVRSLVHKCGQRVKRQCEAFKKYGWRPVSLVVFWGRKHTHPLCLVSNLALGWHLIALYRRRFPIEALFRDYKSYGWRWEQGQVVDLEHIKRLLVGMALSTWLAIIAGAEVACHHLNNRASGKRRTVSWWGKRSLFALGLDHLHLLLHRRYGITLDWKLTDWEAPNWHTQEYQHHARAFVMGASHAKRKLTRVKHYPVRP